MKPRLDKREFFENKHVRAVPEEGQIWRVCQDYEVRYPSDGTEDAYLQAKYSRQRKDKWTEYKPLQDRPDLFLGFAKLHEQEPSNELALSWARRYGLLGYTPDSYSGYENPGRVGVSWEEVRRPPRARELLKDGALNIFWEEVKRAAGVLAMYEAALSGDNASAKEVLFEASPFIGGRFWPHIDRQLPLTEEDRKLEASLVDDLVQEGFQGNYVRYCLMTTAWTVQGSVNDYCHHELCLGPDWDNPSQVVDTWVFENLLGAMYLQMYWMMGSGANTTRCKWCGRLISLDSPYPGAKKRPNHKMFCDAGCRQKWHYHNRVRPKRKGKESQA